MGALLSGLLFPILGALLLTTSVPYPRFSFFRDSGNRFLFKLVLLGLVIYWLGWQVYFCAIWLTENLTFFDPVFYFLSGLWSWLTAPFKAYSPSDTKPEVLNGSLTALAVSAVVSLASYIATLIWPNWEKRTSDNLLLKTGGQLEILLHHAMQSAKPVCISLKNKKVYIAVVEGLPDPRADIKTIKVLPVSSGYRDAETQEIYITTNYGPLWVLLDAFPDWEPGTPIMVTDELGKQTEFDYDNFADFANNFGIVIKVEEIDSATVWNPEIYEFFQNEKTSKV